MRNGIPFMPQRRIWMCRFASTCLASSGSIGRLPESSLRFLHDGGQFLMSVLGGRVAMEIALVDMFQYGLFERFPRLRVGFFEGGAGWVPSLLDKMEAVFDTQVGERSIKRTARPKGDVRSAMLCERRSRRNGVGKNNRRLRPQSIRLGVGFSASRSPRKLYGASCSPCRESPHV